MAVHTAESGAAVRNGDIWSGARFGDELRRIAVSHPVAPVASPLAEAVKIITANPAFLESRVLARLLSALTYQRGEFRRSELSAFDSTTFAVAISLLDTFASGLPVREEWVRAVEAADAAQLGWN